MKKLIFLLFLCIIAKIIFAQQTPSSENYGKTLNLGLGIGYYGYIGHSTPVAHANYEFDVANNFTLAPFITYYSYRNDYYWGNPNNPYRYYSYRNTIVPIGAKGSYYFDQILNAGSNWDFYLAASLGLTIRKTTWDNGYNGERTAANSSSRLYLDGHIGAEYHLSERAGLFLDLSSGVSTAGLALHF